MKMSKLKHALEANGVVVGSTQDDVVTAAVAFLLEVATRNCLAPEPIVTQGVELTEAEPAPAKPKRTTKKKP